MRNIGLRVVGAMLAVMTCVAATGSVIPERTEGMGPYKRLILRNVIYVDGTGAPPQGPVDLVIVNDRIAEIRGIGNPGRRSIPSSAPLRETRRST